MSVTDATTSFQLPPAVRNAAGAVRRAGFELEYAGLSLEATAIIVRHVFGGRHVVESPSVQRVANTQFGTFKLEIDSSMLKDRKYERPLRALGLDPETLGGGGGGGRGARTLGRARAHLVAAVGVPFEVVTPPIPVTDLAPLDEFRRLLWQNEAEGTRVLPWYAFGMHINPEIPSDDPGQLRDYLRAFLLLYPWLKQRVKVDVSRSVSPYINPFPDAYASLILQPDYPADEGRLIDDYLAHNPTRNRPLDMLPVLCHLDERRVMQRVEEKHLVKARPAFHYRLPNCLVDEPGWTLAREWNTWVGVEHLAHDPDRLARMSRDYLEADRRSFKPFVDRWPRVLEAHVGKLEG
jgi:hypothetical protein